jgi:sensor domain CHASE-containing protein
MEGRIRSLVRMARRWEFSGAPTQAAWEADAKNYAHDFPDLQAVEWIDAEHIVQWVIPLAGNEAKLNLNLTLEERRKAAVERAELEHQPAVTRIVRLFRGGLGFVVYVPMTVNGRFEGFIAAIFNAQDCFSHYLPPTVAAGEALQLSEGGLVFFERDAEAKPGREKWLVTEHIAMHGAEWDLRVWPTPALAGRLDSPLPEVILAAGVLGALLLGAVCYYGQRAARQAVETRRANALLQAALDEVKTLSELLPICCQCKRVRDDTGYWNQIDSYLHRHAGTEFSHGYCPECAAKAFTDFGLAVPERIQTELAAGKFE